MENYKIKVNNEAESREAQKLFFQLGYEWHGCGVAYIPIGGFKFITAYADEMRLAMGWGEDADKELTIPQLRDLVVLHRNDVNDATHVTEDNEVYYLKTSVWNVWESGWHHSENDEIWFEDNVIPIKKSEQGLISGADAKLAWAKGEDLLIDTGTGFHDLTDNYYLAVFDRNSNKFKRKPRTIKLELEIPAPFEPKEKDIFWTLSTNYKCGYVQILCYRNDEQGERLAQFGAWRTEEEIKQVVAALRGGIKG